MPNVLLTIAYNGEPFHGWAKQKDLPTVEGEILNAASRFLGKDDPALQLDFQGASRTDRGVHAMGQTATLEAEFLPPLTDIQRALNALTPDTIQIVAARWVDEGFNARHASKSKHYTYRIWNDPLPHPLLLNQTWHVKYPLDVDAMHRAAQHLVGTHDFSSFRAAGCQAASTERQIDSISVFRAGKEIRVDVIGNAFLMYMVRIIVGTLVDVGRGKIEVDDVAQILAARDRREAGPTAPPHGLILIAVSYPESNNGSSCKSTGRCKNEEPCKHDGKCHSHDHDHDHDHDHHHHDHDHDHHEHHDHDHHHDDELEDQCQ